MHDNTSAAKRPLVLVIDDTPQNLALMRDVLESHYTVKLAPSGARGLEIAAATSPDLILLDIMMPDMDGYEVCRRLKAMLVCQDIPVIFVTAMTEVENEEAGLALGAVDYLTKPISPPIVLARVRSQLALKAGADLLRAQNALLAERTEQLAQRNRELEAAFAEIHRASRTDPLTQLKNRRYFEDTIDADLALTNATSGPFAGGSERDLVFFMLDIDHFKAVNDSHGHAAGDELLRQFAQRVGACVRAGDVLLRWGGEEFVLVARFLHRREASAYAERLRACVYAQPFALSTVDLSVSCSLGFAAYPLPRASSWELALELADLAMYQAKHHGRNAWAGVNDAIGLSAQEFLALLKGEAAEPVLLCSWQRASGNIGTS